MERTKVTYIISNVNKSVSFEWIAQLLDKEKFELNFILMNNNRSDLEKYLLENRICVQNIRYNGKKDLPKAIIQITVFLLKFKPKVVHTHLFDASIAGLIASWFCGVKKRVHTRHHSSYHHDYFPKAIKYDKLCNRLSTDIIAVTSSVKEILIEWEFVPDKKIRLIHHGFKLELFDSVDPASISAFKMKYQTNDFYPVIGVISRYTEWKGVQYIIPAFKELLNSYPNAKLVLANASGDYKSRIKELLDQLPKDNYIEIEFEKDLFTLYKLFDVFVHVPIDRYAEAFGQIYVEALASSIPSVFTLSGIANDFIIDQKNALVVDHKNTQAITNALQAILTDKDLANSLIKNGKEDVNKLFPVSKMIAELESLYLH